MIDPPPRNADQFLQSHHAIICKIARSFANDASDYDDLVQEMCISLWKAHAKLPPDVRPTTYAYRVALNRAISWRRRRNTYWSHLRDYWRQAPPTTAPNERGGNDDRVENLYRAIRKLGESDRVLILMYLEQLDGQQISEILGIQPATVRKRLSRVKTKLARLIQPEEHHHDT